MEELEKGPKELKGFAVPQEEQQYESPSTPRAPRDKTINQRVHMELPMAPDAQQRMALLDIKGQKPLDLRRLKASV